MIRTGEQRWQALACLSIQLQKCFEHTARLDSYRSVHGRPMSDQTIERVAARLCRLEMKIDKEIDRLCAERLERELTTKKRNVMA